VPLFKQLLQNIDSNIGMNIDLNDFCKKYIQTHEELKLNLETLKKGIDKEIKLKNELESKIQEEKQEKLNKNCISFDACVSTEIGKITFLNQINAGQIYCSIKLDENEEKRTAVKSIDKANFTEKFTFKIKDKSSTLSYKFFSANSNQFIGGTDVPLYIINLENEEVNPDFEIKDDYDLDIGVFKPKLIIVTSFYDMYQKKYDNIDENIKSYQNRINLISETLDDLRLPYKSKFEKSQIKLLKTGKVENNDDKLVNRVDGVLNKNKLNVNQKEIEKLKSIEKDYNSMKNLLNNYKDENKALKIENNKIKNENNELKKKINQLKMKSNNPNNKKSNINDYKDEVIDLLKKLEIKENEIKQMRQKIPYELKSGEELMPIIFISNDQKIHYAFICKNTDKFNIIENLLYEVYPEYQESENYFTVNGQKVNKSKTIQQNNIKPSSIILLNKYED